MKITIEYKLILENDLKILSLSPELYFDPIGSDENFEEDGIEKYSDPREYINEYDNNSVLLDELDYVTILISESIESDKRIKTIYYDKGESRFIHRKDKNGFELIIQSFKIAENGIFNCRMERESSIKEWKIQSGIGLNYKVEHRGEEKWLSLLKGEFIKKEL
ncbi:hypothetical protein [Flammeovirga aprica]|uniref:Uncharacterized protein n=1 Tax=Flammeovirga aprica JL-4 TaxID=694437 RepID=A0A7X9XDH6_9BACT|nr:hypothetical protein [Flammeovirga aprica]NME72808.1 hypothetical protein [Flammeovirga aprica JL-4]